jgi:hypothetical protein
MLDRIEVIEARLEQVQVSRTAILIRLSDGPGYEVGGLDKTRGF